MDKRNQQIIELLRKNTNHSSPATASYISDYIGCSVRTVKSCIAAIKNEYPGLILSSSKGYTISDNYEKEIPMDEHNPIPQTPVERASYLITRLINSSTPISVAMLCDELCISDSTLYTTLKKVEHQISSYHLSIRNSKDHIQIVGKETSKRRLISSILYLESNLHFLSIDSIQKSFSQLDVFYIHEMVSESLLEAHYFINDYSLINLTLHLTIAIDRIKNSQTIQNSSANEYTHENHPDLDLAQKIANNLQEYFDITFSHNEISEIALLILSRATTINNETLHMNELRTYISSSNLELVDLLFHELKDTYGIHIDSEEFYVRFALHISNLMLRSKYQYMIRNPLTLSIQNSCPLLYEISAQLAGLVYEQTGFLISNDEITYIAFHLGSAFEVQAQLKSKINVVILCPTYYDMGNQLVNQLMNNFSDDLYISNVVTNEQDLNKLQTVPEFLISTIPLGHEYSYPFIQIHPFMASIDYTLIRKKIQKLHLNQLREKFENNLNYLIKETFFERTSAYTNRNDVIHHIATKLMAEGYIDEDFESQVLQRDNISSTAFFDYAIPHTLKMNAKKSAIYVMISETPIIWSDNHPVHLVLLLCFSKNDRTIFNETFEPLSMIMTNNTNVKNLLTATSSNDLIYFLTHAPGAFIV